MFDKALSKCVRLGCSLGWPPGGARFRGCCPADPDGCEARKTACLTPEEAWGPQSHLQALLGCSFVRNALLSHLPAHILQEPPGSVPESLLPPCPAQDIGTLPNPSRWVLFLPCGHSAFWGFVLPN